MIEWFARNSVATNLLMFTIGIGGLVAANHWLRLEAFPPFDIDTISVSVPLRGASPEDIELGAAVRIEEAVKDIEGIDRSRVVETLRDIPAGLEVIMGLNGRPGGRHVVIVYRVPFRCTP